MKFSRIIVSIVALALVLTITPSTVTEAAEATPVNLIVDGKEVAYSNSIGKFVFNSTAVDISNTPTYIFDDNAFINVKKVIKKAIPDATYSYSKKKGRITVTRGNCSVVFYTGVMVVYKNGIATYTRFMPKFIEQNGDGGNFYLPGRIVFETLGYLYSWDSEKSTSTVTETAATGNVYELYKTEVLIDNKVKKKMKKFHDTFGIELPADVSKDDVTVTSDIYKNEIYVNIKGDQRDFYSKLIFDDTCADCVLQVYQTYHLEDDVTVLTIVTQTDDDGLCLLHSDEISDDLVDITFDRAGNLDEDIIILDAGHGANDPGTQNFGINEKDCNFIIAKLVGKRLEAAGIKVYYSRWDDTLIPLRDRAYLGGRLDADMFVSFHHNANNNRDIVGSSVYYSLDNNNSSLNDTVNSQILSEAIQAGLVRDLGTEDKGVLTTPLSVTKYNNVPACLVELSFLSNPQECARSITDDFRIAAADSIADSILKFFVK